MPFDFVHVTPQGAMTIHDAHMMPPHPGLIARMRQQGLSPSQIRSRIPRESRSGATLSPFRAPVAPTLKALVLMVDFSDNASVLAASQFQSMLFSQGTYATGSMRDFYKETSYGQFDLQGDVTTWVRAPQTYSYYTGFSNGFGSYPNNVQRLVEDTLAAADAAVDFSGYDKNADGWIDGLFVIHAGIGAESTGLPTQIWSHKWGITTQTRDGIKISTYSMEPELGLTGMSTMGVFAHEFGHVLGLPDLYDTDYTSVGVGFWSVMASGSWGGPGNDGSVPEHFDPWCKMQLGFVTPTVLTKDTPGVQIRQAETSGEVYKLWTRGSPANEYFLVENRQKTGFDQYMPGSGLVIYHVDESVGTDNDDETHYLVAVEQADGLGHLEKNTNDGDGGDPWPGTGNKRTFGDTTAPNTRSYSGQSTLVKVTNISDSGATMTADMEVLGIKSDLLIKKGSEADTAYAVDDDYQSVPGGDQIESSAVNAGQATTFDVKVQNDQATSTTLMVKAAETGGTGWTVTYKVGNTDITSSIAGGGYTTGNLSAGGSEVITITMTADAQAAGGASKSTVVTLHQDGYDTTVRDAVQATAVVNSQDQADLLVKATAQADAEYQIDNTYQTAPAGEQIEAQSADPSAAASYQVKLENDGNAARTFVLKTVETAETGWTVTYKIGTTDISSSVRGGAGYGTAIMNPGANLVVTVDVKPGVSVPGKSTKTSTLSAYLTGSDTTVLDSVQLLTTAQSVDKADLLIRAGTEPDSAYAADNVYQTAPSGNQIEAAEVAAGTKATYSIRVQNDSNLTRTFAVKATENAEAGWTVVYKVGSTDVSAALRSSGGRVTGSLAPGGFETVTVEMTSAPTQTGGSMKSSVVQATLDGADPAVLDAVEARATAANVEQPDFLIRKSNETDADYAGNGLYQTSPGGLQIKSDLVMPGATSSYLMKLENDGNIDRTFVVKASETSESGWTIVYKKDSVDISDLVRGGGYETPTLAPGGFVVFTVEMTPASTVVGGTSKKAALRAYLDAGSTVIKDTVQASTMATIIDKPDLLIKQGTEADYALDGTYQDVPAGDQIELQNVDRLVKATYRVKLQNDGNTGRTFVLKATENATPGWSVVYKKAADGTDVSTQIRGNGWVTTMLARDAEEVLTIEMTADASAVGESVKSAIVKVFMSGSDTTVRDSVQAATTVNAYNQPDLLIKKNSEGPTAYTINGEYQTTPSGTQSKQQNVAPVGTVIYQAKLENDGNTTRTFVLRTAESPETDWTLTYDVGGSDVSSALRGAGGYTTGSLAPGASELITVTMTPANAVTGGTSKSATLSAHLDGATATVGDVVQATATVDVASQSDLLVKLASDDPGLYGINDVYQTMAAADAQTETLAVSAGVAASYRVKVENDGNTARAFVLRAEESSETGWAVLYKQADGKDITAQVLGAGGYATGSLARGAFEEITVEITAGASVNGGASKSATMKVFLGAGDTAFQDIVKVTAGLSVIQQPDLLQKQLNKGDYATDNDYQTAPSGDQENALAVDPTLPAVYEVKVENDGNTARAFVLRTSETAESGWALSYKIGASDITEAVRAAGYTTGTLARGGSEVVTISMTPDRLVPGGTSKRVTLTVYLDGADTQVRDAVGLTTSVNVVEQTDLMIKIGAESESAYGVNDFYQTAPSGDQAEAQTTTIGTPASYRVKVQNDGNVAARAFVLRAEESQETGWAVVYKSADGADVTAQMRSPAGYTTTSLDRGASEVITVEMTPGVSVTGGTNKSAVVKAFFSGVDPNPRDTVGMTTTLSVLASTDLVIKAASQDDTGYGVDNVTQQSPTGEQVETINLAPGVPAGYQVRVDNEGNTARSFVVKATESAEAGWSITYKVGESDISAQIRGAEGHTTPVLERGGSQVISIEMKPDAAVIGGTGKNTTLRAFYQAGDATPVDCVQAVAAVNVVERPDLLVKVSDQAGKPASAFGVNDVYQATPSDGQVVACNVARGSAGSFLAKLENDGNTQRSFVLRAAESDETGWTALYRIGTTDVSSQLRGATGYTTPMLAPGESLEIAVEMGPDRAVPGGTGKTATVRVYLGSGDAAALDAVQTGTTVDVTAQPDLLVKAGGEVEQAFATDNLYQEEASGDQLENVTATPSQPALYAVRVQNDGNTPRTFVLKATDSGDSGWTVAYKVGSEDVGERIRSTEGYTTASLVPGDSQTMMVQMTPEKSVAGGTTRRVTIKASVDAASAVRDAVQMTSTASVRKQGDLLIKAGSEGDDAFGTDDLYESSPSLEQVETTSVGPKVGTSYQVRVQNDGNTAVSGFILKAEESSEPEWTLVYKLGAVDISAQIRSDSGYALGSLAPGSSEVISLEVTPGSAVKRGTGKAAIVRLFVDGADKSVRDAVQAVARVVNRPPEVATRISPADGAVVSPTPTFVMKATDPDGDKVKFLVELKQGEVGETREVALTDSGKDASLTIAPERALKAGQWQWRVKVVDAESGESAWTDAIGFLVNRAPAAAQLLAPADGAVVSPACELRVKATDPDGDRVHFAVEVIRGDLKKSFEIVEVESGSEATLAIPAAQGLTPGQWSWRAQAIDANGVAGDWSAKQALNVPSSLPAATQSYGMSGFGLAIGGAGTTPAALGLLGARLATWDPGLQRYLMDSEVTELRPGQGYWVKTDAPLSLQFAGTVVTDPFPVPLKRGWNLISPPFLTALNWDLNALKVRYRGEERNLAGAVSAGWMADYALVWQQDDGNRNTGKYVLIYDSWVLPGTLNQLEPWRAYWVKASVDCDLVLPPPGRSVEFSRVRRAPAEGWSVRVQAGSRRGSGEVVLGLAEGGRAFSIGVPPAPPTDEAPMSVALAGSRGLTSVDVRDASQSGSQEWELVVTAAEGRAAGDADDVTLTWPDLRALPSDTSLTLVDAATGTSRYLRTAAGYTFRLAQGTRRFRIVAEKRAGPAVAITGLAIDSLRSNTRVIRFTLSRTATMDVEIIAPDGRLVATVAEGRAAQPGLNQVVCSQELRPGVYLVRAKARTWDDARVQALLPVVIVR